MYICKGSGKYGPLRGGQPGGHAWNTVHTEIGDIPVDVTWNACDNGPSKWFGASDDFATTHWSNPDKIYQNYTQTSNLTPRYVVGTSIDKMNDVLRTMEQTYGSRSEALTRLEYYVSTGIIAEVTRTNGTRDLLATTDINLIDQYLRGLVVI